MTHVVRFRQGDERPDFPLQEMVDYLLALMVGGVCQQLIAADAIKVDGEAASDIMVVCYMLQVAQAAKESADQDGVSLFLK